MAETQPSKSERKREKQPISIPFIWEEKPGKPKKDWKPSARQMKPSPPPVKLVVSVPFRWEEKPGTPLQSFVPPSIRSTFPSPPKYSSDHDYKNWCASDGSKNDQCENEVDGLSDSESDMCSFKTSDSFAAEASSYATGNASLIGASLLDWLFPLIEAKSKFPNKVGNLEKDPLSKAHVQENKEFLQESNCSQVRRPLLTLGELIVMSRRRSCQRKVNRMHKQPSMDFMKRGCLNFGSGNGIGGLYIKWKRQLQLN